MTIKDFASLCGCNPQTLRYYDRIDLLKPLKVDSCSGYRHYEKSQAVTFVKIKNLQAADFSIDEIKMLLCLSDQQVCAAFDRKIYEQTQKLKRIKEIRQSYLMEKSHMEKLVQSAADYLLHAVSNFEVLREFGLLPEEGEAVVSRLRSYIEQCTLRHLPEKPDIQLVLNDQVISGANNIANAFEHLKEHGYEDTVLLGDGSVRENEDFSLQNSETLFECHSWNFVHEWIDNIPQIQQGYDYCFFFQLTEEKYSDGLEFPLFMIAAILPRLETEDVVMGCSVEHSDDGKTIFIFCAETDI